MMNRMREHAGETKVSSFCILVEKRFLIPVVTGVVEFWVTESVMVAFYSASLVLDY